MTFTPTIAAQPWPANPPRGWSRSRYPKFVWRDGAWWTSGASGWVALEVDRLGDTQWIVDPLDAGNPDLQTLARSELGAAQGEPVAFVIGSHVLLVFGEGGQASVRRLSPAGDVAALPPPPVPYVLEQHGAGGIESVRRSVDKVARQIKADFRRRRVIEWARGVIASSGLPLERGRIDPDLMVAALFADLKRRTVFVRDPVNTEAVASTEAILCLDPDGACLRGGDCDDMLVAMGSGCLAIGIPARLCVRLYAGARQGHITLQYDSARSGPSVWKCIDPSTEVGACSTKPYESEILTDVDTGEAPMFVGIGQSPDHDGASTLGQPATNPMPNIPGGYGNQQPTVITTPATSSSTTTAASSSSSTTPQNITGAEAQAWFSMLSAVKTTLDNAAARLQANATAYAAVRADLGLPTVDATLPTDTSGTSAGTTTTGTPGPIVAYVNGVSTGQGVWTQAASDAEQKLLATTSFLSGVLADALAGTRTVSFNNGDLFVQSKTGDAYGVLLVPNAQGTPTLQYVDVSSNAPTGTVGILPVIVIGAVIAVVSLAAAYAVSKYCDYLSQSHHDDAMARISNNQTQLIQSGAETPEQATANAKALTDLASATPPASSTSSDIASITKWIGIAAVSVAAVVGLMMVSRIVGLTAAAGRASSFPMRSTRSLGPVGRHRPIRHRTMRARRSRRARREYHPLM